MLGSLYYAYMFNERRSNMFAIDIIIGILKRCVGFLWEYKYTILISMIITALYVRGNNYKQDYVNESV